MFNKLNISLLGKSDLEEIIDYLNSKSINADYEYDDEIAIELLSHWSSLEYTKKDFLLIIEYKYEWWKGRDTEVYLQPSTLFAHKHFKKYLNEAKNWEKGGKPKRKKKQAESKTAQKSKGNFTNFSQRDKSSLNKLMSAARKNDSKGASHDSEIRCAAVRAVGT